MNQADRSEAKALCGTSARLNTQSVNFSDVAVKLMHVYATDAGRAFSSSALVGGELILRLCFFADVVPAQDASTVFNNQRGSVQGFSGAQLRHSVGNIHPLDM